MTSIHSTMNRGPERDALTEEARFQSINAVLVEVYGIYRQELRDFEIMLWHAKLASFSIEDIAAAFDVHSDRSGFCPRFNDILRLLAPKSSALVFEELQREVMQRGPWRTPRFQQAETQEIVARLGGWQSVCSEMPLPANAAAFESYRRRVEALYEPVSTQLAMRTSATRALALKRPGDGGHAGIQALRQLSA
ncbi:MULTISPECIES: hypothetical protein [unclassified Burkholderia]|uniref:hypothetical protein n=1 Tax=unclassified Burkholderia TaxID=2613784 RepID=UPI002AAF8ACA|nr:MULTISPECIES: hypothetical protein [unclassified Burkholderia]